MTSADARGGVSLGAPSSSNPRSGIRSLVVFSLLPLCLFLVTATCLEAVGGAFQSDFSAYPDEPAQYVTGLMVRDYVAGRFPASPMKYAENYYIHYPQVAFGHWPPGFYIAQAIWTLCFGVSRSSLMLLMATLTALVAFLLYKAARLEFGEIYAIAAGMLFVLLPSVQDSTSRVMADAPVLAFGLMAALRWIRFLDRDRWQDGCWFGIWAALAILTKPAGWSLALAAPLAVVLTGRLRRFATLRFWLPAAVVCLLCAPYYALTWSMMHHGVPENLGDFRATIEGLPQFWRLLVGMVGWPLFIPMVCGFAYQIVRPLRTVSVTSYWASMAALFLAPFLFHALVLHGLTETRHLLLALPAMILFVMAGIRWALSWRGLRGLTPASRAALAALTVAAAFALFTFYVPARNSRGFGDLAGRLLARPDLKDAVFLVSSTREGAFVAAVAERERRPGHFVLRATKTFARTSWDGSYYELLYDTPAEVEEVLDAVPVTILILDTIDSGPPAPHHLLLRRMVEEYPRDWEQIDGYRRPASRGTPGEDIRVYRCRKWREPGPPKIKVDLSDKIGRILLNHP